MSDELVPPVSLSELVPGLVVTTAPVEVLGAGPVVELELELELAAVDASGGSPVGSLLAVPWVDVLETSPALTPVSPWLSDCGVASPVQPIAPMASSE